MRFSVNPYCRLEDINSSEFQVALGKRIGFYRLGKELGAGNFSKVKLGIHVLTKGSFLLCEPDFTEVLCGDRTVEPIAACLKAVKSGCQWDVYSEKVAVKIMDRTKMDTKAQRLLEREIKAMERMHHPNIIRLFEVWTTFPAALP